jgi:UDP-N-acetylglucosamine:LPS N-acetylglucosamine transferase
MSGAGHFAKTPDDLVQRLRAWLADPAAQRKAGESARRLGRPDSAKAIAEAILALAAGPR